MSTRRHLDWDGLVNARDLGGLPTRGGGRTRRGAVVRSEAPDALTDAGWDALREHGVRRVVDLRNDDELERLATPPGEIERVQIPLDGLEHRDFWQQWAGQWPPSYYAAFLERFPERTAQVVRAVAEAPPGGVLVHCAIGRDRTGLITLVLLAAAGVEAEAIADDYAHSNERLGPLLTSRGTPDEVADMDAFFAGQGTTPRKVVLETLRTLDVEAHLRAGGLSDDEVRALRERLVEPA